MHKNQKVYIDKGIAVSLGDYRCWGPKIYDAVRRNEVRIQVNDDKWDTLDGHIDRLSTDINHEEADI